MSQAGKPCFVVLLDTPRAYTDYSLNQFKILPKNIDANMIDHDSKISPLNISVDHVLDKIGNNFKYLSEPFLSLHY